MLLAAWFPDLATSVAVVLGLDGRQTLLFVLGMSIVLLIVLNLHLKNRRVMGAVTALTREIAVDGAHAADGAARRAAHGPAALQAPVESVRPQQNVGARKAHTAAPAQAGRSLQERGMTRPVAAPGTRPPIVLALVGYYPPAFLAGGPTRSIPGIVRLLAGEFDLRVITRDRDLGSTDRLPGITPDRWIATADGPVRYVDTRARPAWGVVFGDSPDAACSPLREQHLLRPVRAAAAAAAGASASFPGGAWSSPRAASSTPRRSPSRGRGNVSC